MKKSLLALTVVASLSSTGFSQVFNRAFANAELGFHYQGGGVYLHIYDHFAGGFNGGEYALAKKRYLDSYIGGIIPVHSWVMDRYDFRSALAGVTTGSWLGRFCGTVMIGPSWVTATECKNISITESEYSHTESAEYNKVITNQVGFSMRADFVWARRDVFGYNFGVRYDANSALPAGYNFTFQLGVNVGIVRNYQIWKRF